MVTEDYGYGEEWAKKLVAQEVVLLETYSVMYTTNSQIGWPNMIVLMRRQSGDAPFERG